MFEELPWEGGGAVLPADAVIFSAAGQRLLSMPHRACPEVKDGWVKQQGVMQCKQTSCATNLRLTVEWQ